MSRIYTQGSFDLFHIGHLKLLERCRKLAGSGDVYVALISDEAYEKYRGHKPIIPFMDRKKVLEACIYVDKVFKSDNEKTGEEIERINPDFVVVGSDWAKKDIYKQYHCDKEWLDQYLIYFPYTENVSSTGIKEAIKHDAT